MRNPSFIGHLCKGLKYINTWNLTQFGTTIVDCNIDCLDGLLKISFNVKGKVKFVRNRLSDSTPRIFATDNMSNPPKHDVEGINFTKLNIHEGPRYSDKEMSEYTESAKGKALPPRSVVLDEKYKRCKKCDKLEGFASIHTSGSGRFDPTEKFRHCSGCRAAVYCSKECQRAHWPDHRLTCKDQRATSK